MLGTGTPRCEWNRAGTGMALIVNGKTILIDAGPGIVRRISAGQQWGLPGINWNQLDTLLLTHLHSDHTLGLPDLMLSPWVLEREQPLGIHGPKGTAHMCEHLQHAYAEDTRERLEGLEGANRTGHQTRVTELEPTTSTFTIGEVTVTTFPVRHGSWPAFGYRFETPHATIVFSGDTAPFPEIDRYYADADLLVHEVYASEGLQDRNTAWHAYFKTVHTSDTEIGKVCLQAQPKALALFHQLYWKASAEGMVDRIREHYHGSIHNCRDLETFYFPPQPS